MKSLRVIGLCAASTMLLVPPVGAQNGQNQPQVLDNGQNQSQAQTQENSQCIQGLQQLAETMQEDGYWLSGYRGYGTVGVMSPSAARSTAPVEPEAGQEVGDLSLEPEAGNTTQDVRASDPWGGADWAQPPQFEIGVLYRAAYVLARNGDEQTCQTLLNATEERYNNYVAELQELGVEPQEVTTWRQTAVATAEPVTQLQGQFQIENVMGSDVRSFEDADLGSIEDVILDPQNGQIRYAVIDHGGFFGMGGQQVVVPWELLRVIPSMNAFVLPVQESTLEQAPTISDGQFIDTQETGSTNTEQVDSYWEQVDLTQQ